jgi:hypothetical protein
MAEIKSTMELVMERAARIGKASSEELQNEENRRKGMQLTAEYLDGKIEKLLNALSGESPTTQMLCRKGMADALVRNIVLARDSLQQERVEKALLGIMEIGGGAGDLASICQELSHIINQYDQHRQQLRQQLEEQVRMQYEQMLAQQPGMAGAGIKIDPTLQPRFKEEWARVESELSSQYNRALEERKMLLRQRF